MNGSMIVKRTAYALLRASLDAAAREQGLLGLREQMRQVIPDISDQFTAAFDPATPRYVMYEEPKIRTQQAFQIAAVLDFLASFAQDNVFIADIGDSSGNHALYLKALAQPGKIGRVVSVNLDPVAVEKVRRRGGEAVLSRAEALDLQDMRPDLFMSFEMIEHLPDPLLFVRALATKGAADHLLVSVPYVRHSRFGGAELRGREEDMPRAMTAEALHMFELSPEDWSRLFLLGGFRTRSMRIYLQYPRRSPLRALAGWWRRRDFEGFAFFELARDLSVAERYVDWPRN